jgi:hypothetical protein
MCSFLEENEGKEGEGEGEKGERERDPAEESATADFPNACCYG